MSHHSFRHTLLAMAVFASLNSIPVLAYAEAESAPAAMATEPPVADTPAPEDTAPPPPEERFSILEFLVDGNSVLTSRDIETTVYPFMGPGKTLTDIQNARKALEEAYHKAGFKTVRVTIPLQKVTAGRVRLQVTESRLGKVRVLGSRYFLPSRIREELQALSPGSVVHLPSLQSELSALNRSTKDLQVTPVFRAGTTPGTVEVDLRVRDSFPLHASLELNNRASAGTENLRAVGTVRYDNLWQLEHSFALLYQTSPQDTDQVSALSATYLFRSNNALDMTAFYALRSSSDLAVLSGSTVIGDGNIFGLRKFYTLPPAPGLQHSLSLGVDYKDFTENVVFGTDRITTPIRYLPFSVLYNSTRVRSGATTQFNAGLNFHLRGVLDRTVDCVGQQLDQFLCKRYGASANYAALRLDAAHQQEVLGSWTLALSGDAQVASGPLISNEQYGIGGFASVRGYPEAARLGDAGWRATVELRTPSWVNNPGRGHDLYGLLFFDYGRAFVYEQLNKFDPGVESRYRLSGAGLGLRFKAWRQLKGDVYAATAFFDGPETQSGDKRVHFRIEYGF